MFRLPNDRGGAPGVTVSVEQEFGNGDPVAIGGERLLPVPLLTRLNRLGGEHGIGRAEIVENRFVGMKSRGVYETPGGTILHRSEEHTSELQSQSNLVCRLLLEKKKST